MCFALAAALQQRGQFALANAGSAVRGVAGLIRLVAVPVWLFGTLILLVGYGTQGVALGHGRLVVVQGFSMTRGKVSIIATTYMLPADQGLFGGATPAGPAGVGAATPQPASAGSATTTPPSAAVTP